MNPKPAYGNMLYQIQNYMKNTGRRSLAALPAPEDDSFTNVFVEMDATDDDDVEAEYEKIDPEDVPYEDLDDIFEVVEQDDLFVY